ncbi:hypothetical protein [Sneathiella sp. HT1-7]|jgi:hypothetical protein|uniref:hypothetical protein n=1 Tax=Sneathiella sp. HT1-7 TaxID=2887192 RepID=UPI001D1536DA|nr:hypothetical protein [Sneathiella sp. HT1-7]MCC3305336.1 hypothetical protein [Sneathiella sp. HT1-7]
MYQNVFFLLLLSIMAGLCLHVLSSRRRHGKGIYQMAILLLNGSLLVMICLFLLIGIDLTFEHLVIAVVFIESFVAIYCLILIGVVNDSPTLAIVKALMSARPEGLTEEDLDKFIKAHPFVGSRLEALQITGDVVEQDGVIALTIRSQWIVRIISLYTRLLRIERETG